MPEETPPTMEDLLKAHIVTLQKCDAALGQCIEVACKMLEQMRVPHVPHVPSEPPIDVPFTVEPAGGLTAWRPVGTVGDPGMAMPGAAIELPPSSVLDPNTPEEVATDPTAIHPGEFWAAANAPQNDPRTPVVDFGALPEGTHPIPQGVRYEGDTSFNSGHTAVIKYE